MEKDLLFSALEERKEEELRFFDEMVERIRETKNLPDALTLYTEIFGNSTRQGEYVINFIKKNFKENFFQLARTSIVENYVSFSRNGLCIMFPITQTKRIIVKNVGEVAKPIEIIPYEDDFLDLVKSCKTYVQNKTKENLRVYTANYLNYYLPDTYNLSADKLSFMDRLYVDRVGKRLASKGIEDSLKRFEDSLRRNEKAIAEYKETLKLYKEEKKKIEDLFENLSSMQVFHRDDWSFFFDGLDYPYWLTQTEK